MTICKLEKMLTLKLAMPIKAVLNLAVVVYLILSVKKPSMVNSNSCHYSCLFDSTFVSFDSSYVTHIICQEYRLYLPWS